MPKRTNIQRAELHTHLGGAVHPSILWSIAHRQGIKLTSKNYWDFEDLITMGKNKKNKDLSDMHHRFFERVELIQSSPEAIEESVQSVIGGGYRACNLVLQELRFDPMMRNRSGERDLDHIIMSAIWGMERAILEYPQVKAGIIITMHRLHTFEQNKIKIRKAIKYKSQGIIGIDLAGPKKNSFSIKEHAKLFAEAKKAGLGLTVHTGEEGDIDEMRFIVKEIKPDRIGHGIMCVKDIALMKEIAKQGIVLETCPTSNLKNNVVKNIKEMKNIYSKLKKYKIKFTINTDGPEMYCTNIFKEQEFLRKNGILTQKDIDQCTKWAFEASFIK
jgi:adenosine deaminase